MTATPKTANLDSRLRFSVVIPAYNEGRHLATTLAALAAQQFPGAYEVIVVDNGSSDDTAQVAREHGARVLHEPRPGVCRARQRGTDAARGEIVVSTDADTVPSPDWLHKLDARFRDHPGAVAVAGPCRYGDPPWWAAVFPPLWFAAVGLVHRRFGHVFYLTATNLAFVRDGFPGYDPNLTQGGDEADILRRLRRRGPVLWAADNPVRTSSRRMDQGLPHTLVVSFGYHYLLNYVLNRVTARPLMGPAPAIRPEHAGLVQQRRRRWRTGLLLGTALLLTATRTRRSGPTSPSRAKPGHG